MKCCITIGEINKNLYILLLAVLFRVLSDFVYEVKYSSKIFGGSFYFYNSILKDQLILQSIIKFFGTAVLSFVFYYYENHQINSFLSKKKKKFNLIHNIAGPNNTKCKYITRILFIGFLFGLVELLDELYYSVAILDADYWIFEILFAGFFMRKIFKVKLYLHQIFSMLFIVILCSIMKLLLFLKINNFSLNWKLLYIPFYLIITLIRSYVNTEIKWLIDIRYISVQKMILICGIFGFFTSLIFYIINRKFNWFGEIAIENYILQLDINWVKLIKEAILINVYMLFNFFKVFYDIQTLKVFSPIYTLINTSLYYLIIQIILIIINRINISDMYIVYSLLSEVISIFGYSIFVELIELKCCGCNYNLRISIIKRGKLDSNFEVGLTEENRSIETKMKTEEENSEQTSFSLDSTD